MQAKLRSKARSLAAFGLAGGVIFVDSANRILSMVGDLVLVTLLLMVLMIGNKPSRD